MKRPRKKSASRKAFAVALTWDGARWPTRSLPPQARAFLNGNSAAPAQLAPIFADDQVRELRVCWVPRLKGGDNVLCPPFATADGKRIPFRSATMRRFGDILGVVYRRA